MATLPIESAAKILVVAEIIDQKPTPATFSAIAFGGRLAATMNTGLRAAVLCAQNSLAAAEILQQAKVSVLNLNCPGVKGYNAERYCRILADCMQNDQEFKYVIIPHTAMGWDYAPRLAVALNAPCITGVSDFSESAGELVFRRQVLNGKLIALCKPQTTGPVVLTVQQGGEAELSGYVDESPTIEEIEVETGETKAESLGIVRTRLRQARLTSAKVIVAAGKGVGGEQGLQLIKDLVQEIPQAALGASRAVCDAGWLPPEYQVGVTGWTVSPQLYLAIGISGAFQHVSAISGSRMIVAVNQDIHAPIFSKAHVGVPADLHEFIPVLIEKLRELRDNSIDY